MKIWTTLDGQKIKYRDLEDSHLLNILKMLIRKAQACVSKDVLTLMLFAPDDVWKCRNCIELEDYLPTEYWELEKEYLRRGLDFDLLAYTKLVKRRGSDNEIELALKILKGG